MHTAHSRRTAHSHTRSSSAAAHSHSADTLVASPATQVHQFDTQELITYLLVCSEADKERRSSPTQTPTHTGLMTGASATSSAAAL
jgi:hypothetical protein